MIKKVLLITMLLNFQFLIAQENIDKIVAIVGDEIILKSELDYQVNFEAAQRGLNPKDVNIQRRILEAMIGQKLLYAQSILDSVTVSDQEVDQQLDYQMNYFVQQYGSRERVEKAYGMSLDRIKREMRSDTRKQMMAERVKQQKFGNVELTRREVEEFYQSYKDSLGLIPEKFDISHIFINPKASEKVKKSAYKFAASLIDSIKLGKDFSVLAKKYSDDPGSKNQGGDLGTVKRGVFYPEFEAAAYSLKPGETSAVVESPVGFHVIQLLERKGEAIHARHILIKIKNDSESDLKAIEMLTEIRDSIIRNIKPFDYFAAKYSDDKETSKFGGNLGTFETAQLDKSLLDQVYKMKEGDIGFPKRLEIDGTNYGFHIVRLNKRIPEHIANIKQDYEEIKKLAQFQKREKLYQQFVNELKENIFWQINI
ncbi:MAG: peptidylprolyl isomerase [Ignavibacteriales bacterium]